MIKELVPLLQTFLWIALILWLIKYFKFELKLLREVLVKRLESGSSFKAGPLEIGELKNQVESVRQDINEINQKIIELFLTTMSPKMYFNLEKLAATDPFGKYEKTKGLERELYHLRDIVYVDIESIKDIPESGDDLSKYVKITDTGKAFVKLRATFSKEQNRDIKAQ